MSEAASQGTGVRADGAADVTPAAVRVERLEPGIAVVTLARAQSRNALSLAVMEELDGAINGLSADGSVRAIVLAAEGPVFSSGHDLKELTRARDDADGGAGFFAATMTACATLMQDIVACGKPVIAAVQGTATAAGCQLVATCDLAVAAETAQFCTPGVTIGLFCSTPMVALSRNVSRKRAMEMLLLGELMTAAQALDWGLVNRVVPAADVLPTAMGLARQVAAKSPVTVALGKAAFYAQAEMGLADAYRFAAEVMVKNMMEPDAKEGIGAFLEKRPAVWKSGV